MVSAADFEIQRIVVSGFIATDGFSPPNALRHVLEAWPEVYDGEVTSLPLGPDAPPDLPSVVLASGDGAWRLEMSRARVNVAWIRRNGAADDLGQTLTEFARRLADVIERAEAGLGRLAAIVVRRASVAEPGRALARQFAQPQWLEGPLNRPEGFELHAHKEFLLMPDLTVNSWIRIKAAKGASPDYRYITVEHDINTLANEQESRRFGRQEIEGMFDNVARELDDILSMYFPLGGNSS